MRKIRILILALVTIGLISISAIAEPLSYHQFLFKCLNGMTVTPGKPHISIDYDGSSLIITEDGGVDITIKTITRYVYKDEQLIDNRTISDELLMVPANGTTRIKDNLVYVNGYEIVTEAGVFYGYAVRTVDLNSSDEAIEAVSNFEEIIVESE